MICKEPAFPVSTSNPYSGHQDGPNTWQFPGMTLRDYFAAKAMQAYFSNPAAGFESVGIAEAANAAYRIADAMLAARSSYQPSVPDGFAWPECPKRRQSHVLFDDGYEEGWAACIATIKAALAAPEAKP